MIACDLLTLNHEHHAEEIAADLHDKKGKKGAGALGQGSGGSTSGPKRDRKPKSPPPDATDLTSPRRNLFDTQLALGEVED